MWVIGRRVGREAAGGTMLEPLVDRQDQHLAGTAEFAGGQDAGEIGFHAGVIALIPVEDFFDLLSDAHGPIRSLYVCGVGAFVEDHA
jgi:hypothetical protein